MDTRPAASTGPHWRAPSADGPVRASVLLPGSKSMTNRALVLAALADGPSLVSNPLRARDTLLMAGALTALLWGGLVRIFFVHHVTWSVNSVCHFLGSRRWDTQDESRNVGWLSIASLGESWHHNHHAFPRSAYHGLRWYEIDISALVIRLLAAIGLAREVVGVEPELERRRTITPPDQPAQAS